MNTRFFSRALPVLLLLVVAAASAAIAFHLGAGHEAATDPALAGRGGPGEWRGGWGGGWFFFRLLFAVLFFTLLFSLFRAFAGGRGPWGGWSSRGPESFEEWHRHAHQHLDAGTSRPPGASPE